ncbi:hypothetical protein [Xanthomonas phage JGB6]|nr:hypothetical protein [Xanthomonas phage JGB6]
MTDPSVLNAISNLQAQQAATDNRLAAHINTLQMQITNLSAMLASATTALSIWRSAGQDSYSSPICP